MVATFAHSPICLLRRSTTSPARSNRAGVDCVSSLSLVSSTGRDVRVLRLLDGLRLFDSSATTYLLLRSSPVLGKQFWRTLPGQDTINEHPGGSRLDIPGIELLLMLGMLALLFLI